MIQHRNLFILCLFYAPVVQSLLHALLRNKVFCIVSFPVNVVDSNRIKKNCLRFVASSNKGDKISFWHHLSPLKHLMTFKESPKLFPGVWASKEVILMFEVQHSYVFPHLSPSRPLGFYVLSNESPFPPHTYSFDQMPHRNKPNECFSLYVPPKSPLVVDLWTGTRMLS